MLGGPFDAGHDQDTRHCKFRPSLASFASPQADCEEVVLAPDGSWRPAEASPGDETTRGSKFAAPRAGGADGSEPTGFGLWMFCFSGEQN